MTMTEQIKLPKVIELISHEKVTSTNEEAKLLANKNAPEGTVIWAKEQTAGKGRMNRNWVSKPGNLFSSVILRPTTSLHIAAQLSFLPALAVGELLNKLHSAANYSFKWPNDVLLNGKKISGILLESASWDNKQPSWLVIGCGINLLHSPLKTAFPATSIFEETDQVISVNIALSYYYQSFFEWYTCWCEEGFDSIRQAWLSKAYGMYKEITVICGKESYTGRFDGLDKFGALKLKH